MDIGPGDYVECIDASWHGTGSRADWKLLKRGALYVVTLVVRRTDGLHLAGMPMHNPDGYATSRFRKVYRPKADVFTHLLTDISSDLEAV